MGLQVEHGGKDRLPTLRSGRVTLRPAQPEEAATLLAILQQPSVAQWWGTGTDTLESITADIAGTGDSPLLVIDVDGAVAGGIYHHEEEDADYHHAGIDIFIGDGFQNQGIGRTAIALLARHLIEVRKHHRLTIDPAAANARAIACYRAVGFRPVGVMRQYERGRDGSFHDGLLMDLLASELIR
jgi:aminoglycoside 6'-N-acetyltransferase